jgi:integrase
MAIVTRDKHGTYGKRRKAEGPRLDRVTTRYFATFQNVWSKGYRTRAEAEAAEREMKGNADNGVKLERGSVTFSEFVRAVWWPAVEAKVTLGKLKQTTAAAYRIQLDTHITPNLGERKLRDIEPRHLRKLHADLKKSRGLSTKSLRNLHVLISNILKVAESDGYIVRNPAKADGVYPGRRGERSPEQKSLTPDQVRSFLAAAEKDRLAAAWRLAAVTGMRRGEVLGLRWGDLDLEKGRLAIERAYVQSPDRTLRWETPKSETGKRTITVDARTVETLKAHRARQAEEQLAAGELWRNDDIVFCDELGRPIHPVTFSARFGRVIGAAGLPRVRLHDLRHTAVTLTLMAGEDVHVAAQRFGHRPEVMLSTYAHVLREQQDAAAERIAAVFDA